MSSDRSACMALRIAKAVGESTGATGRAIAIGSERRGPFNSALLGEKPLDLYGTLEVLGGHVGEVDPATLEDFIESLRFFWPLCSSQTLIKALLALGQANALDVGTCRLLLQQLEARSEFLGRSDREALLLLLALHKSSFDRSTAVLGLPHPLYDEAAKRLIKDLSRDACGKISSGPIESLSRPVLALAELKVLDRRALHALTERLVSGRLLSLSPSAFVSLVYAHRLVRGPVPLEKLRMPLCLAFGALLHAMTAKQVGIPGRSPTKWALK
ncbi:unnamed protein product [Cladocopium goreaui]|uniref:Phosphatidylinositol N-acetylglucosaminyltransferase (GlcNAc-PI synthesi s protein) n=1 Tax=Cladocopium goreaui TaxID=2562237 RepID=A0A9P1BW13_9DINO|nr:unnamed protein product [Cladocopium goreaui]